ncbi:MAG: hypothetical protein ACRDYW_06245 [Acidimicrobiales bacterium]
MVRRQQQRVRQIAVVGMACGLLLGACSTDRELTEPEPVAVTEERLAATLLTAQDLPAGFTAAEDGAPISTEVLSEHDCDDALGDLEPEESASRDFTGNGVELTDTAAWFPGQGRAVEQLFRTIASRCSQLVIADAGIAVRSGDLDFGVLSDDVLAIRFEIEPDTGPITERDVIVMRQGDLLHVIRLNGPRPSDKALLDTAVRPTLGRLGLLHQDTTDA